MRWDQTTTETQTIDFESFCRNLCIPTFSKSRIILRGISLHGKHSLDAFSLADRMPPSNLLYGSG